MAKGGSLLFNTILGKVCETLWEVQKLYWKICQRRQKKQHTDSKDYIGICTIRSFTWLPIRKSPYLKEVWLRAWTVILSAVWVLAESRRLSIQLKTTHISHNLYEGRTSQRKMAKWDPLEYHHPMTSWYKRLSECCWKLSMNQRFQISRMASGLTEAVIPALRTSKCPSMVRNG